MAGIHGFPWGISGLHSLKLTANAPENRVFPKGNNRLPTIHFQVLCHVSVREGIRRTFFLVQGVYSLHLYDLEIRYPEVSKFIYLLASGFPGTCFFLDKLEID